MGDTGWDLEGQYECVGQTHLAIMVRGPLGQFWVPQSAVHDDSEVYAAGKSGKLVVHTWWATMKGWDK